MLQRKGRHKKTHVGHGRAVLDLARACDQAVGQHRGDERQEQVKDLHSFMVVIGGGREEKTGGGSWRLLERRKLRRGEMSLVSNRGARGRREEGVI